jgi:MscS family membrane protein
VTRNRSRGILFWIVVLLLALVGPRAFLAGASAQSDLLGGIEEPYPLRAADASSPRDTLRSFLRDFSETIDAWQSGKSQAEILRPMRRAADAFRFQRCQTARPRIRDPHQYGAAAGSARSGRAAAI